MISTRPSRAAAAEATRAAGVRSVIALARVEGRRMLSHPAMLAGFVLVCIQATLIIGSADLGDTVGWALNFGAVVVAFGALLAANLTALRSRRNGTEELYGSVPVSGGQRTAAHVLATLWPALAATAVFTAADFAVNAAGFSTLTDTGRPLFPRFDVVQVPLVTAVSALVGIAVARWVPSVLGGPVAVVSVFMVGDRAMELPSVSPAWTRLMFVDPSAIERPLGEFAVHVAYVIGFGVVLAAVAALRHGATRGTRLAVAAGLALAVPLGAVQVSTEPSLLRPTACTGGPAPAGVAASTGSPDLILHEGSILTMDDATPRAEAVAVRGERIVAVGSASEVMQLRGPATRVVDLDGAALLPGFIDSHAHWIAGMSGTGRPPEEGVRAALAHGWTTISETAVYPWELQGLCALARSGALDVRMNAYLTVNGSEGEPHGTWYAAYSPGEVLAPGLRAAGLKVYADGGDPGEWFLSRPYAGRNSNSVGRSHWDAEGLADAIAPAVEDGWQVAAHSMGDGATDVVLDAFERALRHAAVRADRARLRIEHAALLRDDQIERMRRLGVVASIQLPWFDADGARKLVPLLGPDRVLWVARWRDLLDAGVRTIGGTDSPYGVPTRRTGPSMDALYRAATRAGDIAATPPPWMLDQRITVDEALRLITIDAAYGAFEEDEKGSIAVGKLADLVVLSADPTAVPPQRLRDIDVVATFVGGHPVHCAAEGAAVCERR